ncbi:MAG: uL30 family ribosomal protein [Candidatus Pacearchaeota archaeon]|nr:uL30 family ribosomal protein [Candidatus Pacearchaeota archaeon]
MIAVIRISGLVEIPSSIKETLFRLHLRKKYSLILMEKNKENLKLLNKIRNFVSYGEISPKLIDEINKKKGKSIVLNLHPPRGGINSKLHYPKGVLGENKEIEDLIRRML